MASRDLQHPDQQLKRTMKSRHIFMISLGGVIGTGFFVGSGYTINQAGPLGAILSYLIGGFIMLLTMLCLGELSVAMPVSGSFQTYATRFIGPSHGFMIGWTYWLGWAVTVALELLSASQLMQRWFPHAPIWMWCLLFGLALFALNALSAKSFGETEFWFASVKVLAVILFILLGAAAMFGLIRLKSAAPAPFFANFHNSWLPQGVNGLILTMITVNFSFQGTELIGIAAGESEDPEQTIPRSIRNTVWRTIFFFVVAMIVLSSLISWKEAGVSESPFVLAFDKIGIPYAADIMNFVILTALLSVANSGLYAATRMLWSLSQARMAPQSIGRLNQRGIPFNALVLTMIIAFLSLLSSVYAEQTVYVFLVAVAGLGAQVGWIAISASQLAFRRHYLREGGRVEDLKFKTPLYPLLPAVGLILNIVVLLSLAADPTQRIALYCGIPFMIACYIYYAILVRRRTA